MTARIQEQPRLNPAAITELKGKLGTHNVRPKSPAHAKPVPTPHFDPIHTPSTQGRANKSELPNSSPTISTQPLVDSLKAELVVLRDNFPGTVAKIGLGKTEYAAILANAKNLDPDQVRRVNDILTKIEQIKKDYKHQDESKTSSSEGSPEGSPLHSPKQPQKAEAPHVDPEKPKPTVKEGCTTMLRIFMSFVRTAAAVQEKSSVFDATYRTYRADGSLIGVNIVSLKKFIDSRWSKAHSSDTERVARFVKEILLQISQSPSSTEFALFLLAVHPDAGHHSTLNSPLRNDPATGEPRSKHNFKLTNYQRMSPEQVGAALSPKLLDTNNVFNRFVATYLQRPALCNLQPPRVLDIRAPIPGITQEEDTRIALVEQIVLNLNDITDCCPRIPIYQSDYTSTGYLNTVVANERLPFTYDTVYICMPDSETKTRNPLLMEEYGALSLMALAQYNFARRVNKKLSAEDLKTLALVLTRARLTLDFLYCAALKQEKPSLQFGPQNAQFSNQIGDFIKSKPLDCATWLIQTPLFKSLLARMGVST